MSFHAKHRSALLLCDSIAQSHPGLSAAVDSCRRHYLEDMEKPSPHLLAAALCLLTQDDFTLAARKLSQNMHMHIIQAEKHIIESVNQGPDFLQKAEAMLHDKGVIRGTTRYFFGFKGIAPGSLYDRAWKSMDPAYRPILNEAVEGSMKKHKVLSQKVLHYVSAALMPEDDLKYFELNKLSMRYGKSHDPYLKEAASFIRGMAKKYDIDIPETMLSGLLSPKKASYERTESLPAFITKPASAGVDHVAQLGPGSPLSRDFTQDVQPPSAAIDAPPELSPEKILKRRLERLEKRGEISDLAHRIYFYLNTEGKNGPRFPSDAVEYLRKHEGIDKGERYVQILVAHVNTKLRALIATEQASNGDLHEPRAVRP